MPERDAWYDVTIDAESLPTYRIRAAYLSVDERLFPGWTQLKTEGGSIAAVVRSDRAVIIKRLPETPETTTATADPPKPAVPSPALLAGARR
jgi:hypothetical protein